MAAGDTAGFVDSAGSHFVLHAFLEVPGSVGNLQCHHNVHAESVLSRAHGAQHSQTGASPLAFLKCLSERRAS